MRTLAIDLGSRRVGLALSDEGGQFATPYEVLTISSPQQAMAMILPIIEREAVQRLVVGIPLNMDDTIGPAARQAAAWAAELARQAGRDLVLVDERLSSFSAEQQLIDRKRAGEKLTRQRKKRQLDAVAAALFLQAFLDGKLSPLPL
jgi:putative Holliday junction resolvase